jgi:hypothetical protein
MKSLSSGASNSSPAPPAPASDGLDMSKLNLLLRDYMKKSDLDSLLRRVE